MDHCEWLGSTVLSSSRILPSSYLISLYISRHIFTIQNEKNAIYHYLNRNRSVRCRILLKSSGNLEIRSTLEFFYMYTCCSIWSLRNTKGFWWRYLLFLGGIFSSISTCPRIPLTHQFMILICAWISIKCESNHTNLSHARMTSFNRAVGYAIFTVITVE